MVEVEILGMTITHQYGTLNTGDVLRTSPEFAKHLVEDCAAAKYRGATPEILTSSADAPPAETAAADDIEAPPGAGGKPAAPRRAARGK